MELDFWIWFGSGAVVVTVSDQDDLEGPSTRASAREAKTEDLRLRAGPRSALVIGRL